MYIIVSTWRWPFVPDMLSLSDHVEPKLIYEVILNSITAVIGLSIAVIFIFYELTQTKFGGWANSLILQRSEVKHFALTFLTCYSIAFISLLNLNSDFNNSQLTQLYYSVFLYIGSFILVAVLAKRFIKGTDSHGIIKASINELGETEFDLISKADRFDNSEVETFVINDKIKLIHTFTDNYITDNNRQFAELIISELVNTITNDNRFGKSRSFTENRIRVLVYFLRTILNKSSKEGNEKVVKHLIDSSFNLYRRAANDKHQLLYYYYLKNFINEIVNKCFKYDFNDLILHITKNMCENILNQLKFNCPTEDEIDLVFSFEILDVVYRDKPNFEASSQWEEIESDFTYQLRQILKRILNQNKLELLRDFSFKIKSLISDILNSDIGDNQKGLIAWEIQELINHEIIDYLSKEPNSIMPHEIYQISYSTLRNDIKENKLYVDRLIETSFEFFKNSLEFKPRNQFLFLNDLGVYGRVSAKKYESDLIYRRLFKYVLENFKEIKKILETDMEFYKEEYITLSSLCREYKNIFKKEAIEIEDQISKKLEKLISSFKKKNLKRERRINLEKERLITLKAEDSIENESSTLLDEA